MRSTAEKYDPCLEVATTSKFASNEGIASNKLLLEAALRYSRLLSCPLGSLCLPLFLYPCQLCQQLCFLILCACLRSMALNSRSVCIVSILCNHTCKKALLQ